MPIQIIKKVSGFFKSPKASSDDTAKEIPVHKKERAPQPESKPQSQSQLPIPTFNSDVRVIESDEHNIPRKYLDDNAAKVVYRLLDGGHQAYLVGGCIRDLLLKKRPKDFDVATSAHPEEAHGLFKRSRLIGRRFKLLHVRFGRDIIEVATFRAAHDSTDDANDQIAKQSDSGLILRDNVYGTVDEDAVRRDFTINALYYSMADHRIYDFANGYDDLQKRTIRMIGDPASRYREDPVRMLRAIRFSAKLNFDIEPATEQPIRELAPLLNDIASARLFDEVLKLLQSGHGARSFELLESYNLLAPLLPLTANALKDPETGAAARELIMMALKNTDRRLSQRKSVTPAFLFAVLLWHPVQKRMQDKLNERRMSPFSALQEAADEVIQQQVRSTAIPKRFSIPMREIWEIQLKLPSRHGNRAYQTLEQSRFRAAYDLLLLREQSGEALDGLSQWWTQFQSADEATQAAMISEIKAPERNNKRKPSPKPKRDHNAEGSAKRDAAPRKSSSKPSQKPAAQSSAPRGETTPSHTAQDDQPQARRRRSRAKNDPRNRRNTEISG
jgi:poly(A) polymerase